jgi:hypothetical protein
MAMWAAQTQGRMVWSQLTERRRYCGLHRSRTFDHTGRTGETQTVGGSCRAVFDAARLLSKPGCGADQFLILATGRRSALALVRTRAIGCAVVNLAPRFSQTHRARRFYCRFAPDRGPRNLGALLQGIVQATTIGAHNHRGLRASPRSACTNQCRNALARDRLRSSRKPGTSV